MNPAQEAARKLLFSEIPTEALRGLNAAYGLTLGFGSRYIDALRAAWQKRAVAGEPGAAEAVKWIDALC